MRGTPPWRNEYLPWHVQCRRRGNTHISSLALNIPTCCVPVKMATLLQAVLLLALTLPFTIGQIPSYDIRLASRRENMIHLVCDVTPPSQRDVVFFLNGTMLTQQEGNTIAVEITRTNEGHYSCGSTGMVLRQSSRIGPYAGKVVCMWGTTSSRYACQACTSLVFCMHSACAVSVYAQ